MALLLLLSLGWSAEGEVPPPAGSEAVLRSPLLRMAPGDRLEALGPVTLSIDGAELEAQRLLRRGDEWLADEIRFFLRGGWEGEAASAQLTEGGAQGALQDLRCQREGLQLSADAVQWVSLQRLSLESARWSPCSCEPAPWSLSLKRGVLYESGALLGTGGWLMLKDRRLVPLPVVGRLPDESPWSPALPVFALGDEGLILGAGVRWESSSGSHQAQLRPEWRQERGWRTELGWEGRDWGLAQGAWGWDQAEGSSRWVTQRDLKQQRGEWSLASQGQAASDPDYLEDYGVRRAERSTPWLEGRSLLSWGDLQADALGWSGEELSSGWRSGLAWQHARARRGPARASGQARVEWILPEAGGDWVPRLEGGGSLELADQTEAVEWSLLSESRGLQLQEDQALDQALTAQLGLPMWSQGRTRSWELSPQLWLRESWRLGALEPLLPEDEAWSSGWGPALDLRSWDRLGWLQAQSRWDLSLSPAEAWSQALTLRQGAWTLWLGAEPSEQFGVLSMEGLQGQRISASAASSPDLWALRGRWQGIWWAGSWRPSLGVLWEEREFAEASAGLEWRSGCDCLQIGTGAAWDPEEPWPRVSLSLQLSERLSETGPAEPWSSPAAALPRSP